MCIKCVKNPSTRITLQRPLLAPLGFDQLAHDHVAVAEDVDRRLGEREAEGLLEVEDQLVAGLALTELAL